MEKKNHSTLNGRDTGCRHQYNNILCYRLSALNMIDISKTCNGNKQKKKNSPTSEIEIDIEIEIDGISFFKSISVDEPTCISYLDEKYHQ